MMSASLSHRRVRIHGVDGSVTHLAAGGWSGRQSTDRPWTYSSATVVSVTGSSSPLTIVSPAALASSPVIVARTASSSPPRRNPPATAWCQHPRPVQDRSEVAAQLRGRRGRSPRDGGHGASCAPRP